MAKVPFVLIVTDHDAKTFTIEGPMFNDNPWNAAVCNAQKQGRQINCHVPGGIARSSPAVAARMYVEEYDYRQARS
jgi:hypothetical protein